MTPAILWVVCGFLAGMLLGCLLAFWLVWQLVTAAENTAGLIPRTTTAHARIA